MLAPLLPQPRCCWQPLPIPLFIHPPTPGRPDAFGPDPRLTSSLCLPASQAEKDQKKVAKLRDRKNSKSKPAVLSPNASAQSDMVSRLAACSWRAPIQRLHCEDGVVCGGRVLLHLLSDLRVRPTVVPLSTTTPKPKGDEASGPRQEALLGLPRR